MAASDNATREPVAREVALQRKKWHVFISHKARDGQAATQLKGILERSLPGLNVFVSSDANAIVSGDEWHDTIHTALDGAHWVILLYTDPTDNWDWCLYECGFHAAKIRQVRQMARDLGFTERVSNKLTVLCPSGVTPPAPLSHWQFARDKIDAIEVVLNELGGILEPRRTLPKEAAAAVAAEIARLVSDLKVTQSYACGWVELTIDSRLLDERLHTLQPNQVHVLADERGSQALSINPHKRTTLDKVPKVIATDPVERLDFPSIKAAMQQAHSETMLIDPPVLPLSFSRDYGTCYRPVIQRSVQRRADHNLAGNPPTVTLQLLMVEMRAPFPAVPDGIDLLHNLLWDAKYFRWAVVEHNLPLIRRLEEAAAIDVASVQLLRAARYEIDRCIRHSMGKRLSERVADHFTGRARAQIKQAIKGWEKTLPEFTGAIQAIEKLVAKATTARPAAPQPESRPPNPEPVGLPPETVKQLIGAFDAMQSINAIFLANTSRQLGQKIEEQFAPEGPKVVVSVPVAGRKKSAKAGGRKTAARYSAEPAARGKKRKLSKSR